MIQAEILADSITDGGSRLVTWLWTYPRSIHAEVMTYRVLSRNLASSRAISMKKMRRNVQENPVIPIRWGSDQKGMQAGDEIEDTGAALDWWMRGHAQALALHLEGEQLGLHKQIVNRVTEPWMYAVGIISMTDHANLFHQRRHHAAEPHFQRLANLAWEQFHSHMPTHCEPGEWHIPYLTDEEREYERDEDMLKISVGRCARVSYMTHDGKRDPAEDIALHDKLAATGVTEPLHGSPFEHQAVAIGGRQRFGNFEGWKQYRASFKNESGPDTSIRCERCGCWGGRHVNGCPGEDQ